MPPPVPIVILASASPRRSQLLQQIGVPHRVWVADIDETRRDGEGVERYVQRLACEKAQRVQQLLRAAGEPALPVLAADTTVAIGERTLGKPRDREDAIAMLALLSARTHSVASGVALAHAGAMTQALSVTQVCFRAIEPAEAAVYWDSGEPADKAGGYAIQGRGAVFVESLQGSFSGVMGLPLAETARLLRLAGVPIWLG